MDGEHGDQMWRELMAEFGPWYRIVAEAPEDPSLN